MKCLAAALVFFLPLTSSAHHSFAAGYDQERTVELEGELTEVRWQNPHIRFTLVTGEGAAKVSWGIESLSANGVTRDGISASLFKVGDRIRIAGNPSRRGLNQVWVTNVLLPSGTEVVLGGGQRQPRWSDEVLRASDAPQTAEGVATDNELGIFRVWSNGAGNRPSFVNVTRPADPSSFPLTAAGRATVEAEQLKEDVTVGCVPKSMPRAMNQPYPIEFVRQGDTIVLKIEEYDTVRAIHMAPGGQVSAAASAPSPLGYSTGRWEARTLVVTTTDIVTGALGGGAGRGVPISAEATLVEQFTPSDDGARLDYRMTVTDAATFTEPITLERRWVYVPGTQVLPYDCKP